MSTSGDPVQFVGVVHTSATYAQWRAEQVARTVLQIADHTTDTHGATELVFALFDLLGLSFIRDYKTPASCACTASASAAGRARPTRSACAGVPLKDRFAGPIRAPVPGESSTVCASSNCARQG